MLCHSISVNMKGYSLRLKQKSTAGFFHRILQNVRTATFQINFGDCFWEKKKKNRGKGHVVTFVVSAFHFFQGTYSQVMKQSSFSTNFCIVGPLSLNYVIRFYKPKKGLFLSRFQQQKLLVGIRKINKVLHDNLPRVNECYNAISQ